MTDDELSRLQKSLASKYVHITKPQLRLLAEIREKPRAVADYWPPAKALVRDGWAEWIGSKLMATMAGVKLIDSGWWLT